MIWWDSAVFITGYNKLSYLNEPLMSRSNLCHLNMWFNGRDTTQGNLTFCTTELISWSLPHMYLSLIADLEVVQNLKYFFFILHVITCVLKCLWLLKPSDYFQVFVTVLEIFSVVSDFWTLLYVIVNWIFCVVFQIKRCGNPRWMNELVHDFKCLLLKWAPHLNS